MVQHATPPVKGVPATGYAAAVHLLRRLVLLLALAVGLGLLYRMLQATTAPNAELGHGSPLPGSLDTWPDVPAAPDRNS
jgi:hypothetical protein